MNRYWWIIILLPLLFGLLARLATSLGWIENYVLSIRIDLGTLTLFLGILASAILGIIFGFVYWQERKHAATIAQLEERTNQERIQFLQRLDHELKNPLTAIQVAVANVNGAENQIAVESIQAQSARINRLVADLRKLAELETWPIERIPVDIGGILQDSVGLTDESGDSRQRKLNLNLPQAPWPLPKVDGDEDLLMLAIHNLLDNAIKFTKQDATIEIRAYEDANMVVIEFADTGFGIPEEELPFVWQELYRGKGARGVPGSGLGLTMVRAIIELHHGHVGIRSRVDQGTVLTIRLPVSAVTDQ